MSKADTTSIHTDDLAQSIASVLNAAGSTVPLDLKAIWTASEVCAYYRIGRDTLRDYMAKGLPFVTINGSHRFERLKVKRYLERQLK